MSPNDSPRAPTISVVIAVLNARDVLEQCLASIRRQTLPGIEIVVIDGGSTDGTLDLLRASESELAHWQTGTDEGIYDAWNKALPHTRGDWLYFIGADDVLHDDRVFERMAAEFPAALSRGIQVVYGQVAVVAAGGKPLFTEGRPWPDIEHDFRYRRMAIPHQGCFTHRDVFSRYGNFDASFRIAGDYEHLLRTLKDHEAWFVPGVVARMSNAGISHSLRGAYHAVREQRSARRRHGLDRAGPADAVRDLAWRALIRAAPAVGEHRVRRALDAYLELVGKPKRWSV